MPRRIARLHGARLRGFAGFHGDRAAARELDPLASMPESARRLGAARRVRPRHGRRDAPGSARLDDPPHDGVGGGLPSRLPRRPELDRPADREPAARWLEHDQERDLDAGRPRRDARLAGARAGARGGRGGGEPIGSLVRQADAQHARLTPRELLTMTSGLHGNYVRDFLAPLPDRVCDALALPFDHAPGTTWHYAQTTLDLLIYTVERAVGADIQTFAREELFGRVGIPAGS